MKTCPCNKLQAFFTAVKYLIFFLLSAQNRDCRYALEAPHKGDYCEVALSCTHNLCFEAKVRKIYTNHIYRFSQPCHPAVLFQFCVFLNFKLYLFYFNYTESSLNLFLKARMLALCGPTWWRKPENPGKTTEPGRATTTLPHALTRIRTRIAVVTSECVIHYAIQAPYCVFFKI